MEGEWYYDGAESRNNVFELKGYGYATNSNHACLAGIVLDRMFRQR
jgi:hypothetical protein